LIALAKELGVGIQRLKLENDNSQDIYDIGGQVHTQAQMLRGGRGAFIPLANRIGADQIALTRPDGSWSERATELDAMSLRAYLEKSRGRVQDWALDLVDLAYWGEYGVPTTEQSALNLVDMIGTETAGEFEVFGESDEAYRIEGGSSSLPDALLARLGENVRLKPGMALSAISAGGSGVQLTLKAPRYTTSAGYSIVALALPFSKLREVEGLDTLGLDPMKLKSIKELGYGDNAKIMIGTKSQPWKDSAGAGLPAPSNGTFYSPEFQVLWDTSRGQAGTRGILTNYLTATEDQASAVAKAEAGMRKISPAVADSLDAANIASFFWAKYPFNKGSFSAPKVGQYTTLLEVAGTPELGGRLQFAGEHTSAEFPGYMCGAVDSGERAARAILALV
jgi:monoamine oxidase